MNLDHFCRDQSKIMIMSCSSTVILSIVLFGSKSDKALSRTSFANFQQV